jgi:hypothetical protein
MLKCEKCSVSTSRSKKIVVARKMVTHATAPAGPRGSVGSQIAKEISVCEACAAEIVEAPIERNAIENVKKPSSEATMALAASMRERAA